MLTLSCSGQASTTPVTHSAWRIQAVSLAFSCIDEAPVVPVSGPLNFWALLLYTTLPMPSTMYEEERTSLTSFQVL